MKEPSESEFLSAYDAHADSIFRFCYVQVGDREKAKDIVQEAYIRAWKYLAKGKTIADYKPFLYQTARNIIIDLYRKNRTDSLDVLTEKGFDVVDASASATTITEVNRVIRAMSQLEPKYREVVTLRFVQEMQPREIAQITGETENAISIRIHRGLEKVRLILDPDHDGK